MLVSVLGSSDFKKIARLQGKKESAVRGLYASVGEALAKKGANLLVTPDKGIVEVVKAYKKAGGRKVVGIVPRADDVWGIEHLKPHLKHVDEELNPRDWFTTPYYLVQMPDYVVCLNITTGVFGELAFVKWLHKFNKLKPKRVISFSRFPKEVEYDIKPVVRYVSTVDQMVRELR
jgi:hypothetical protein